MTRSKPETPAERREREVRRDQLRFGALPVWWRVATVVAFMSYGAGLYIGFAPGAQAGFACTSIGGLLTLVTALYRNHCEHGVERQLWEERLAERLDR